MSSDNSEEEGHLGEGKVWQVDHEAYRLLVCVGPRA